MCNDLKGLSGLSDISQMLDLALRDDDVHIYIWQSNVLPAVLTGAN